jgi:hypothetical protein
LPLLAGEPLPPDPGDPEGAPPSPPTALALVPAPPVRSSSRTAEPSAHVTPPTIATRATAQTPKDKSFISASSTRWYALVRHRTSVLRTLRHLTGCVNGAMLLVGPLPSGRGSDGASRSRF